MSTYENEDESSVSSIESGAFNATPYSSTPPTRKAPPGRAQSFCVSALSPHKPDRTNGSVSTASMSSFGKASSDKDDNSSVNSDGDDTFAASVDGTTSLDGMSCGGESATKKAATARRGTRRGAPPARSNSMPLQRRDSFDGDIDMEASAQAAIRALEMANSFRADLDSSMHSYASNIKYADEMAKDIDHTTKICDLKLSSLDAEHESMEKERKLRAEEAKLQLQQSKLRQLELAKEARMERVRDRITKDQAEKEEKLAKERARKIQDHHVDNSEEARRIGCWEWYTRSGMPPRDNFRRRVENMPASAGISVADIDLLPWNKRGNMVNPAEMNKFMVQRAMVSSRSAAKRSPEKNVSSDSDSE